VRRRRPRAASRHHQPPPAADPLPAATEPFFELIAAIPGEHDVPTVYVLRDIEPAALQALGADLVAAQQRGDPLQGVLATWAAIQ
jgi:hypothetical protein